MLTIFFTAALDLATKSAALAFLGSQRHRLLGNILSLHLLYNSGAAFSFAPNRTTLLTALSMTVGTLILLRAREFTHHLWLLSAGLVVGGICGNLIDRIFRAPGALAGRVIDWIELPHWPTFNLADSSIVLGAALAAILIVKEIPSRKSDGSDNYQGGLDERDTTKGENNE